MFERAREHQRGQSLVELALMAPILLLILLMAVDFGRVFLGWVTVNNMARIGANYASLNPKGFQDGDPGVAAHYRALMQNDASEINCALPGSLPDPAFSGYDLGNNVQVDISCDFPLLTPLLSNLIGDADGNIAISASAIFNVRSGAAGDTLINPPRITPAPASPSPQPSAPSSAPPVATPDPAASGSPVATIPPVTVSFYGAPAGGERDATGGGPPGSPSESQIVSALNARLSFSNTTTGTQVTCLWDFGDGTTNSSCASSVSKSYTAPGIYAVSLTVNGSALTRSNYVVVSCKVPDFHNKLFSSASGIWTAAGFTGTISRTSDAPATDFRVKFQSLVGGQVDPPGGCAANISLGP